MRKEIVLIITLLALVFLLTTSVQIQNIGEQVHSPIVPLVTKVITVPMSVSVPTPIPTFSSPQRIIPEVTTNSEVTALWNNDDINVYNGYNWYGLWVPGMVSFETQYLRLPTTTIGSVVFYAPDVMRANVEYYGLSMDGCVGAVAVPFASEIGHKVWLMRPGYDWEGPFIIADSSRRNDIYGHIIYRDQIAEIDFDTAVRWEMARYGGNGNKGMNNEGRWTALTGRLNHVIMSFVPPEQFDGTIIDLNVWFLQNVKYAERTENRYQVENYVPPGYVGEIWHGLGFNNPSDTLPMWLINGEWVSFP